MSGNAVTEAVRSGAQSAVADSPKALLPSTCFMVGMAVACVVAALLLAARPAIIRVPASDTPFAVQRTSMPLLAAVAVSAGLLAAAVYVRPPALRA
jgi:hypothetical protein